MYIYIYIYKERERERVMAKHASLLACMCICIIYTQIYWADDANLRSLQVCVYIGVRVYTCMLLIPGNRHTIPVGLL